VALHELPSASAEPVALRLGVHDSSRLEWIASLALPARGTRRYELRFSVEIPANLYSPTNMWDYVQQFTRLRSPTEEGALRVERGDPDELRRDVLGVAQRLKSLRQRYERTCIGAAASSVEPLHAQLEPQLRGLVDEAAALVAEMRRCLVAPAAGADASPELVREWQLADEFLSHQLLDFYAGAHKALDEIVLGPYSRLRELDSGWSDRLCDRIAEALAEELDYRKRAGLLNPRADSPSELSQFVERGSHLKKHFQNVLFLDVEAFMVDHRLRNWTGIAAASLAASFWLGFTLLPVGPGARAGLGVGTFAVLFAAAYAVKDRLKELARAWLAGGLTRLYGQRSVTLRLPSRIDPHRQELVEARETCDRQTVLAEDPLNRLGGSRRMVVLGYRMRADLHASTVLARAGIRSIKHIFRYDLGPIFSRLDNAVKAVPVLDETARRVRFADAPKEYRLPVRLVASGDGVALARRAELVLSKRGIERLENLVDER
jgi:hypothetical protein